MSDEHPQAKAIFFAALEQQSREELAAFLDQACGQKTELRARVEDLLRAHQRAGKFLGGACLGTETADAPAAAEKCGTKIGPYKLLQKIGEGGMGVVYMAEQSEPVKRRVALKIIKPGMDSQQVIARFEAERQALAMMDHPNIARVLDAGQTDGSRPYFVMELVNGISLTAYCDEKRLTPEDRIRLFISICRGVQHAHQKGIIHRDLKPSNVLVAEYDHDAVPKVIDFGVAKAISQSLTEKTMFTEFGQIIGTLEYMSPEQAKRNQLDIDTRTDIYALGVMLYELLTGDTPFDRQRLRSAALDELIRIIQEEEPPKPSTRVRTSSTLPSVAACRRTDAAKLSTLISGDLDWIVMKSLEKDRGRRYATAHELATDLSRYLVGDPVEACPPSTFYRLRKAVVRSRGVFATIAAISLTLLVATIVSSYLAVRESLERNRANRERNRAIAASNIADEQKKLAIQNADATKRQLYAADIGAAWRYLMGNNVDAALSHLRPHYSGDDVSALTFDGRFIWSECRRQAWIEKRLDNQPNSVAFSGDGSLLAVTDIKGYVTVWELGKWDSRTPLWQTKCEHGLDEDRRNELFYTPVAFSPTRNILAFVDDRTEIVRLLDLDSRQETRLEGHSAYVTAIAFSPNGDFVATASRDGTCRVWQIHDLQAVHVYALPGEEFWSVTFAPDGNTVAAGTNSGVVGIFQLAPERTETLKCTMVRSTEGEYPEERDRVWQLDYSPDGSLLAAACSDATVKLWNMQRKEQTLLAGHSDQVRGVAFTDLGNRLVSGGRDGAVRIWDVASCQEIHTLRGGPGQRIDVHGTQLATGNGGRAIRIWSLADIRDPDMYQIGDDVCRCYAHDMAFAPDGRKVAILVGSLIDPSRVRLFDLTTRRLSDSLFEAPVHKIAMSRRGKLAALTRDHRVVCFDIAGNVEEPLVSRNSQIPVSCLTFSQDGSQLVIGRNDGHVEWWDAVTGECVREREVTTSGILHVFVTKDAMIVATAERITIVDPSGSAARMQIPVEVKPYVLAFAPETNRLAFFGAGGTLEVVDFDDSTITTRRSTKGGSMAFRFIDGGATLVTTTWSGHIGFWSVDPLQHRTDIIQPPRRLVCSAISPDGTTFVAGGQGYIRIYRADISR